MAAFLLAATLALADAAHADEAEPLRFGSARTILDLQPFRESEHIDTIDPAGRSLRVTLTNLQPHINVWYLLTLDRGGAGGRTSYHLENPDPAGQRLHLSTSNPDGIEIRSGDRSIDCRLWSPEPTHAFQPYTPLCDGHLELRNRVAGHATQLEWATDFLRDHVWGGEAIIGFVRKSLADRFLDKGTARAPSTSLAPDAGHGAGPASAELDPSRIDRSVAPSTLAIDIGQPTGTMSPGRWYPARDLPGVYASFVQPQMVAAGILASHPERARSLDPVEADALVYLVAFDLADFDLAFALGTEHPRVGWSDRPPASMRQGVAGPDGIDSIAPLISTGMVAPYLTRRTVAAFTGGFKRQHGAFRYGALATRNRGSHYGFIEQGVVFSTLQPGLSTLFVLDDGTVGMKSWSDADNALLPRIRFARQNGVALVETDPVTNRSIPGPLVAQWGPGNWSGTAEEQLRALRAGVCLQEQAGKHFLVYGWFSTATPSAMARVFQAYGCRHAMHLDMNALEHTYLALYLRDDGRMQVEHLVEGMTELDRTTGRGFAPRFLTFPDDRDFFYLTRRER